ncbi:PKD domain-containing protein [Cryobacterium tepidiphilum]|uniref:PKD domain-containing protein n=1 Tax=Cryobacterium tepidiphilum TaxID=2486026 RepID=UPI0013147F5F|nr:PKD domain-containing protein [Cryobacterium tepidiphilum]
MHSKNLVPVAVATLLLLTTSSLVARPAAAADDFSFTVIGDVPYGETQYDNFTTFTNQINADPALQMVSHIGDISSPLNCSDAYYADIKSRFDRFADPFVYTPGDNEWTDCSRATVGAANPLERLAAVRSTFFPSPGTTLGANRMSVTAQSGYPENVRFNQSGLTFATLHIVGSNNDLNTWSGYSSRTSAQSAEVTARTNADIAHLHDAFAQAKAAGSRAVVLLTQADMFYSSWTGTTYKTAFQPLVRAIASESASFQKPVFLINGDSHSYVNDKPLTSSTWLSYYGISSAVPNLTRVTIHGGTSEYARFTQVSTSAVLSVTRVPYQAGSTNAAPTAAFSATTDGLSTSVNGSGSKDSDGTIASYAWSFGDGATASGATASHTYATAGTYTVRLTVKDNAGATGTTTRSVTVASTTPTPTPSTDAFAQDSFGRTVSGGFGTADTGGAWTVAGTASSFAVGNGSGTITLPRGRNLYAYLNAVSSDDTDLSTSLRFTRPSASSIYTGVIGRRVGTDTYGARVIVNSTGRVQLQLQRNTDTILKTATVSGLTFNSGDSLQLRLQVTGTAPTTLQAKVWKAGSTEPGSWTVTAADSTASLQSAGGIGLYGYLSSSATPTSIPVAFDNLAAVHTSGAAVAAETTTPTPTPTTTPTQTPTEAAAGTELIQAGSSWRYWYSSTNPPSGWAGRAFDDSGWDSGRAPMGWGTSDIATTLTASTPKPLTSYHRASFTVADAAAIASVTLTARSDDGIVVYVNGTEVGRHNLPAGTIGSGTYATTAVSAATALASPVTFTVPGSALVDGANVVSVEVHSNYHAAASHSFELTATS